MRFTRPAFLAVSGVLALLAFFSFKLDAGEGQWLPEQIASLDFDTFAAQGLELSPEEIWDGTEGLLSAAVHINGCSSSFVSADGLIVTNHHCGFSAINSASTVEQNYLEDGFVAETLADEIPAPGVKVSFVTRYEDVTAQIEQAAAAAGNEPAAQYRAVQKMRDRLEREAKGELTSAIVVPYFEGRYWRRIWQTEFNDVRLVYAPPRAVGEFGGETDNWMWPRHTGDFTFFRAYATADGKPSAYSSDNVPYNP
ncbi:MAG: S46 family peptidase, partial [Planctomycetota bacterium]|nr:S46 family peptidase [Planctomycetota bacterium]